MILGQNFKFLQSLYIVKLDLEIMFVDVLEWNKLNWFWRYMNMSNLISRLLWGSKGSAVVRALSSHHCGPGSNPGVDAICGLSLLLVLSLVPRGFSPGTPVFPSPQKPTLPNPNSIWNARTRLNEFIWTLTCFVDKTFYKKFHNSLLSWFFFKGVNLGFRAKFQISSKLVYP